MPGLTNIYREKFPATEKPLSERDLRSNFAIRASRDTLMSINTFHLEAFAKEHSRGKQTLLPRRIAFSIIAYRGS